MQTTSRSTAFFRLAVFSSLIAFSATLRVDAAEEPILRVEADGPTSSVTSLAFSPDGRRLYTAGLDKLVRGWDLDPQTGRFALEPDATLRVPIGPGDEGFIYCIAVSRDGKWLAVGGRGAHRASPGFRKGGFLTRREAVSDAVRADDGQIYLFDTATGEARTLRGHLGPVLYLAFGGGERPSLFSLGRTEVFDSQRKVWQASVRRFDVFSGNYLSGKLLPEPEDVRPSLAVLGGSANAPGNLQALLAWGDGRLRVWDVGENRMDPQDTVGDGQFNSTVAVDGPRGRVLTGSFSTQKGASQIQIWQSVPATPSLRALANPLVIERTRNVIHHPQAIALVPGREGASDRVALLLQNIEAPRTTRGWELQIYQYGEAGFGPLQSSVGLPDFGQSTTVPALAVSPTGEHVALASGERDEALVLALSGLDGDRLPQPQRLSSALTALRSASFVRKGPEDQGLLIRDIRQNVLVYDFAGRQLTEGSGWVADAADAGAWNVTVEQVDDLGRPRDRLVVTRTADARGRVATPVQITLPKGHRVTAHRLVPSRAGEDESAARPVLAVASTVSLSPTLAVYDVATGGLLRRYTGHTATIRSIDATEEGRLLVTTGDDHIVCVWSLIDLSTGPTAQGGIPGLTLTSADPGGLQVEHVASIGPAAGILRTGDRVIAVQDAVTRVEASDADAIFDFIEAHRAGDVVQFELAGGRRVPVRLTPAVDERKPLFTLFIDRDAAGELHWVGWSPLGPFDASDEEVERSLGWHFNTPSQRRPVRFARLDEYAEFRRPGVLQEMLRTATPPAVAQASLPAPVWELTVPELVKNGDVLTGENLLSTDRATAQAAVVGLAPRSIRRIEVRVNGEPIGQMQPSGEQDWTLPLDEVPWKRGFYEVQAVLVTDEPEPQRFTESLKLRYQPSAPRVQLVGPMEKTFDSPKLRIEADITPAPGETCRVELVHLHNGQSQAKSNQTWTISAMQRIERDVDLGEGVNEFEIRVANVDAMPGFEQYEKAQAQLAANYAPVPPPEVVVSILSADSQAGSETTTPMENGGFVKVMQPRPDPEAAHPRPEIRVQLTGGAALPRGLVNFVRLGGIEVQSIPIEISAPRQAVSKPLPMTETGEYTVTIQAETSDGAVEIHRGTIAYTPPLPAVSIVQPEEGAQLIAERDEPVVLLEAHLDFALVADDLQVVVLRNGLPLDVTPTLEGSSLRANVPVEPGANRLQILLDNGFVRATTSPVSVSVLQLPRVVEIDPQTYREPLCDLRITGRSATPLQKLHINGRSYATDDLEVVQNADQWEATIEAFPLKPGENRIEVVAYNADGAALEPHSIKVPYEEPSPPPKPIVRVEQPAGPIAVSRPSAQIEFTIATESPLRRYEIYQKGARIVEADKGDDVATDPQGRTVHTIRREVKLYPGVNDLRVVAVNDGGAEEVELAPLSYIEAPITFEITGIEQASKPGEIVAPERARDGTIGFKQAATDNLVYIHGKVSWNNQGERLAGIMAFVNEFQWPAVSVRETQANEADIKIPALLNREKNVVTLASAYDKDSALQTTFTLDCTSPAERTWLHLLVVGVGVQEKDRDALRMRALASLGNTDAQPGTSERPSPVFERVFIYGPLVGPRLGAKDIHRELMQIDAGLQTRGPDTGRACDVVMLYYEGGDIVMTQRGAGISTRPVADATAMQFVEHTLTVAYLEHFVRRLQGAQVMLLELAKNASLPDEADLPSWRNKTRTAVFRYVWLKNRDATAEGSTLLSALRQLSPEIQLAELDAELNRIAASDSDVDYQSDLPSDMRTLTLGP